jgi:hypothetical protein
MKPDFTVKFGRIARTILYQDSEGELTFTLDSSPNGRHSITLEHHPLVARKDDRYDIAFERAKQHLESCGFQVETYDPPSLHLSVDSENVISVVHKDSHGKIFLHYQAVPNEDGKRQMVRFWRADLCNNEGFLVSDKTAQASKRFTSAMEKAEKYLLSHDYKVV